MEPRDARSVRKSWTLRKDRSSWPPRSFREEGDNFGFAPLFVCLVVDRVLFVWLLVIQENKYWSTTEKRTKKEPNFFSINRESSLMYPLVFRWSTIINRYPNFHHREPEHLWTERGFTIPIHLVSNSLCLIFYFPFRVHLRSSNHLTNNTLPLCHSQSTFFHGPLTRINDTSNFLAVVRPILRLGKEIMCPQSLN